MYTFEKLKAFAVTILMAMMFMSCGSERKSENQTSSPGNQDSIPSDQALIPVIFDTDANNELDDQHALAYLLFSTPEQKGQ